MDQAGDGRPQGDVHCVADDVALAGRERIDLHLGSSGSMTSVVPRTSPIRCKHAAARTWEPSMPGIERILAAVLAPVEACGEVAEGAGFSDILNRAACTLRGRRCNRRR
ncbi:hypothetical protein ABZT06_46990 [Streptomyces sp. NPDC005483]|uniref:hypothetical protein n=1 Tax=Streptomyces sp. NPDC005483 TaxID=3154882 RepID=UPI00339F77D9